MFSINVVLFEYISVRCLSFVLLCVCTLLPFVGE